MPIVLENVADCLQLVEHLLTAAHDATDAPEHRLCRRVLGFENTLRAFLLCPPLLSEPMIPQVTVLKGLLRDIQHQVESADAPIATSFPAQITHAEVIGALNTRLFDCAEALSAHRMDASQRRVEDLADLLSSFERSVNGTLALETDLVQLQADIAEYHIHFGELMAALGHSPSLSVAESEAIAEVIDTFSSLFENHHDGHHEGHYGGYHGSNHSFITDDELELADSRTSDTPSHLLFLPFPQYADVIQDLEQNGEFGVLCQRKGAAEQAVMSLEAEQAELDDEIAIVKKLSRHETLAVQDGHLTVGDMPLTLVLENHAACAGFTVSQMFAWLHDLIAAMDHMNRKPHSPSKGGKLLLVDNIVRLTDLTPGIGEYKHLGGALDVLATSLNGHSHMFREELLDILLHGCDDGEGLFAAIQALNSRVRLLSTNGEHHHEQAVRLLVDEAPQTAATAFPPIVSPAVVQVVHVVLESEDVVAEAAYQRHAIAANGEVRFPVVHFPARSRAAQTLIELPAAPVAAVDLPSRTVLPFPTISPVVHVTFASEEVVTEAPYQRPTTAISSETRTPFPILSRRAPTRIEFPAVPIPVAAVGRLQPLTIDTLPSSDDLMRRCLNVVAHADFDHFLPNADQLYILVKTLRSLARLYHADPSAATAHHVAQCCRILHKLTLHGGNHRMIAEARGISAIVAAMNACTKHVAVAAEGCIALRNLAVDFENDILIAAAGGIEAIISVMKAHSCHATIAMHGCAALRNLSGKVAVNHAIIARSGGLDAIILVMRAHISHIGVAKQGCAALRNLAGKSARDNHAVAHAGGVEVIIAIMRCHASDATVIERACAALRNLTANAENRAVVVHADGITVVYAAMYTHASHAGIVVHGCAIVKHFEGHAAMRLLDGSIAVLLAIIEAHLTNAGLLEEACSALLSMLGDDATPVLHTGAEEICREVMWLHASNPRIVAISKKVMAKLTGSTMPVAKQPLEPAAASSSVPPTVREPSLLVLMSLLVVIFILFILVYIALYCLFELDAVLLS